MGALAAASTPGRARTVALQVAFAVREADAAEASWLRNVDAAQAEAAAKRATAAAAAAAAGRGSGPFCHGQRSLVLVLDGLRSAENVGNLFRTAEVGAQALLFCSPPLPPPQQSPQVPMHGFTRSRASVVDAFARPKRHLAWLTGGGAGKAAGADLVVTCGSCPRPPDRAVLKTAVKSADYVASRHAPSAAGAITELQADGYSVWGLETTSKSELYTSPPQHRSSSGPPVTSYPLKIALVCGNEVTGVAPAALECCDRIVAIPTFGVKNSLNVAVAGSVVAYEVVRAWGVEAA